MDLNNFVLTQPTAAGVCAATADSFKITSASASGTAIPAIPAPSICGTNSGQHSKFVKVRYVKVRIG